MQFVIIAFGAVLFLMAATKAALAATRYVQWAATAKALRLRGIDPALVLEAAEVALARRVTANASGHAGAVAGMEAVYADEGRHAMGRLTAPFALRSGLVLAVLAIVVLFVGIAGPEQFVERYGTLVTNPLG